MWYLLFSTRNTTGLYDVATERMRIMSNGNITLVDGYGNKKFIDTSGNKTFIDNNVHSPVILCLSPASQSH